jgi:diguanylate cyclase (GGDEF)-like protein/PAS domain S-box-containing protein
VSKKSNASVKKSVLSQNQLANSTTEVESFTDVHKKLHELQLVNIELELLNENLTHAQSELENSWSRYFDLYHQAPVGYLTLNNSDIIVEANLSVSKLLGYAGKALIKKSLTKFILPMDQDIYYRHRQQLVHTGKKQIFELRLQKHGGAAVWVLLEINRTPETNAAQLLRVVISDISQQKADDVYLRQAASMFETAREGMMVTDSEGRILVINQAFTEQTGYLAKDVIGHTPEMLKSDRQDEAFYRGMWEDIQRCGYWHGEIWGRHKNGQMYPKMLSITTMRNQENQLMHYVGVFSDLSQLKLAETRFEYLAHHDPLTGLSNRLLFDSRLEHCLGVSRRDGKCAALFMMDLDRFKEVNDSFGHAAGDELLQQVALKLTNRLRGIDTLTRLGGDEFALLLEDLSNTQDAALVASKIIEDLSDSWSLSNGVEVRIGVSIGISLFPEHGATSDLLMQNADAALYRAKAEGRGNFKYFSEDITQAALHRIKLEAQLRLALGAEEFKVYYQPQVEISSGSIVGAEALLRWHNAELGTIPPSQFIPIAEGIGLIGEIGEWVIKESCRQGLCWIEAGLPFIKLAVNLSLHQFRQSDLVTMIAAVLEETGFPPERLELELTEMALMEREPEMTPILSKLRSLGISLAIDDFGSGYTSFAYLKDFPLDILKMDNSFVEKILQRQEDSATAVAIIGMAHTLGLKVLAEGVETLEQLEFLSQKGCDYYQGYCKSPALSAQAYTAFLKQESLNSANNF